MTEMTEYDISAAMSLLDEKLKNAQPKRRGRKALLAPYADQLRRYVAAGWSRKEIVAEMKALGISISAGTLRNVLGEKSVKRESKMVKTIA
ncbi:hypothetical protein [Acidiphilium sp. JA12-A1]|uniref:hypothetical protein n=1 Tax=Acidiphilium sp. JA12-A1 TaxID=1464546 RepID=UPI000461F67C|nr:hypothetical protein [Acidiphilium sp. JA12-A1]KDM65770.1 hypothetical protein ACIDI_86c00030 [Acidiphilium sp. JA12-A1]